MNASGISRLPMQRGHGLRLSLTLVDCRSNAQSLGNGSIWIVRGGRGAGGAAGGGWQLTVIRVQSLRGLAQETALWGGIGPLLLYGESVA